MTTERTDKVRTARLHRTGFGPRYQSMHPEIHTRRSGRFSGLAKRAAGKLAAAAVALAAGSAEATWSIVIVDTRTGEVAVGSATCLFGFDLQANTPVLLPMIGGAAAQSAIDADGTNRVFIRDRLLDGVTPPSIISGLASFDSGHQTHQYGIADALGGTATFTGTSASAWAGGVTGSIPQAGGDIIYSIQGNILTGAPVVFLAENAIKTTDGDVAARLMAGMEAARSMGGDGRCSCAAGPTLCGSPPSTPWQLSAGISYMLIGRDGDREGSSPIYKVRSALPMAVADFNKDGKPDVMVGSTTGVYPMTNTQVPTGPIRFGVGTSVSTGSGPRGIAAVDFDGDGSVDAASCNINGGNVSVLMGKGDGTFKTKVDYAVGSQPIAIASGDFNGDSKTDLLTLQAFASTPTLALLTGKGDGTFNAAKTTALASTPTGMAVGDFNGDTKLDVAVVSATAKTVTVYIGDGAGNFAGTSPVAISINANSIDAGDFDKDGLTDLVLAVSADPTILVLRRTALGFDTTTYNCGATGTNGIVVADLDQDGNLDFAAATRSQSGISAFMGNGAGSFATGPLWVVNNLPSRIVAADVDGDGDLDLIVSNSGVGTVTITPNLSKELGLGAGQIALAPIGCGSGDYFMEFNVLGPGPGNQDPVFVDKDLYDAWRSDLVDKADAVKSTAAVSRTILPSDGSSTATIDLTVRDWQGNRVTRALNLTASHHAADLAGKNASDGISTIGSVTSLGNGDYRLTVRAGSKCGKDRIAIRVSDPAASAGTRPVILMPSPVIQLSALADRDGNGVVDLADFMKFWMDFDNYDAGADLTNDGIVDLDDFFAFFNSFDVPCAG